MIKEEWNLIFLLSALITSQLLAAASAGPTEVFEAEKENVNAPVRNFLLARALLMCYDIFRYEPLCLMTSGTAMSFS